MKKLVVIDNTKTSNSNGNFVYDASYSIEGLDYSKSSFKIPYININSEDAKKVNEEIKNNFKMWASESAKYKNSYKDTSLNADSLIKVEYELYNYENILSVVICFKTRENNMESNEYYCYSFNTTKESIMINSNEELIDKIKEDNGKQEEKIIQDESNFGKLLSFKELLSKLKEIKCDNIAIISGIVLESNDNLHLYLYKWCLNAHKNNENFYIAENMGVFFFTLYSFLVFGMALKKYRHVYIIYKENVWKLIIIAIINALKTQLLMPTINS